VAATPSESLNEVRAGVLRRPGLVSAPLREALSDAYDSWLRAALPDGLQGISLVAVGGLGRREPAPYSDLDLVLLHDGRTKGIAELADSLWYPIWDSGVGLDHSVRTPDEALDVAREDLRALLGLLDLRFVAGDEGLATQVRARVIERWQAVAVKRVDDLRGLCEARRRLAGEGAYLLEPNLKDSQGGLRDVQSLRALARAQLVDLPPAVRSANGVLLDARGELQRVTGHAEDVLRLQDRDAVASALGLVDADGEAGRDELLRGVNHAARTVVHALELAWRRIDAGIDRRPFHRRVFGSSGPVREGIARDVVAQDGEVVLARDATPRSDPGLVLRAARAAATNELPFATHTLDRFVAECPPLPDPWPAEVRDDFIALLGSGTAALPVFESLDLAGLLTRIVPEWDSVRSLAQHSPVHRFTVDRHLLETAARASERTREVARPDLLLVGAVLHDIGKGYPGDHSIVGAEHARVIARRMGFDEPDVRTITALVRQHLLLPDTATRRDLADPVTVKAVADAVDGSADILELLHTLAVADAAATGPAAWSDWKAGLVAELVAHTRGVLRGIDLPPRPPIDDERRELAEAGRLAVLIRADEIVVVAPDSVGVLYRTAGVLALHSLDVRSAFICTHAGMAVNSFVVSPRFGRLPDPALMRADLARALDGELGLAQRLRDKELLYNERAHSDRAGGSRRPPDLTWFDDAATDATVLEIRAEDSIGLLCRLTAAFERSGTDVRSARVSSLGGSVVDAFYLTTREGAPIPHAARPDIELELRAV